VGDSVARRSVKGGKGGADMEEKEEEEEEEYDDAFEDYVEETKNV
jgi:hypothetical protein